MIYDRVVWGYSFLHEDQATMKEMLESSSVVQNVLGVGSLSSSLLEIDPIQRHWYVHREYDPLVEARAHQFGARRKLLNDGLRRQYTAFLNKLCFQRTLSLADAATAAYYLFLMLRDDEAITIFEKYAQDGNDPNVPVEFLDYLRAFISLKKADLEGAQKIVENYKDHPVFRIRERMATIGQHIQEAQSMSSTSIFVTQTKESKTTLSTAPTLSLTMEGDQSFAIRSRNLTEELKINYYVMDIELLFSTSPFSVTSENTSKFSYVHPTFSETIPVDELKTDTLIHKIPSQFQGSNLMVEVIANELRKSAAYFANKMKVNVIESFGQLQITDAQTNRPLPKTYVKVYGRDSSQTPFFFKDGYTDIRGVFDYASLTNNELQRVSRFAILAISEEYGALITEASPPLV